MAGFLRPPRSMPATDTPRLEPAHSLLRALGIPAASALIPRWIFLRALGLIFVSAFYSFARQILGLIGERGILPAGPYLHQVAESIPGASRFWYAPSLFWISWSNGALAAGVVVGIVCSLLLVANVWPRAMIAICTIAFLSFIAVLQDFSSYQSDGMLLEAGFISFWFAPRGFRPGLGALDPPSRLSLFLLRWEWFRIYFESGVVKLLSGDVHWRNLTAMDEYYQNGPLPTWIGWYVQHLPHTFHAATVVVTLVVELIIVWAMFLPQRFRLACCVIVTALQVGIIATANYAFLNYIVLALGFLLLDDDAIAWILRAVARGVPHSMAEIARPVDALPLARRGLTRTTMESFALAWVFYATLWMFIAPASSSKLALPARALAPFRIANAYGLFAVMTEARYEIEFQGSNDGRTWTPYVFRYKPQLLTERPGIYAPYQPRFEWNLWFASLAPWQASSWVISAQGLLVVGSPAVLGLFRGDPFGGHPPLMVRTVKWQYWFTDLATRRETSAWWRRRSLGDFAGVVSRDSTGGLSYAPPMPDTTASLAR